MTTYMSGSWLAVTGATEPGFIFMTEAATQEIEQKPAQFATLSLGHSKTSPDSRVG